MSAVLHSTLRLCYTTLSAALKTPHTHIETNAWGAMVYTRTLFLSSLYSFFSFCSWSNLVFFSFFLFSDAHLLLRLLLFSGLLFIFQSQPRELKICFQVRCCFLVSSSFFVENKRTLLIMDIFVWPQSIGSSKTPRNVDRWSEQQ